MNYLAHMYLSDETPEAVVGGLLGDFVKGATSNHYHGEIRQGIELHRKIDRYADAHDVFLASKQLVGPARRRYAGIMVDVFYDHFLAKYWSRFSSVPLAEFTGRVYEILYEYRDGLPERLQYMLPYMAREDWLGSYCELGAVHTTLNGISRKRFKRKNRLENSAQELEANYGEFKDHFFCFFPELIEYVASCKREVDAGRSSISLASTG